MALFICFDNFSSHSPHYIIQWGFIHWKNAFFASISSQFPLYQVDSFDQMRFQSIRWSSDQIMCEQPSVRRIFTFSLPGYVMHRAMTSGDFDPQRASEPMRAARVSRKPLPGSTASAESRYDNEFDSPECSVQALPFPKFEEHHMDPSTRPLQVITSQSPKFAGHCPGSRRPDPPAPSKP
jgi:hypothetical protein